MRYFLAILVSCFMATGIFGANPDREYKKLMEKYDVGETVRNVEPSHPAAFWVRLIEDNEQLNKFLKDMKKNKGAEKEAVRKTAELPRFYPSYDSSVAAHMQGYCDTLLINMGIADIDINCSLHVIYADEVNAFTALTEDGFAMGITTGLLEQNGLTYEALMGYVAHEFAHGVLLHHMRNFYAEAKERRKNELLGGLAMGLYALTGGIDIYSAVTYGMDPGEDEYTRIIEDSTSTLKYPTLKYTHNFSREQEFEADLIAYRFLENLGCPEESLRGLKILGMQYDHLYKKFEDHPTTSSRIEFLNYVSDHPEIKPKKK